MVATVESLLIRFREARHLLAMVVRVATEPKAATALVRIKMAAMVARAEMVVQVVLPLEQMALQAEAARQPQVVMPLVGMVATAAPAGLVVLVLAQAQGAMVAVEERGAQVVMPQGGAQAPALQWFALRRKVVPERVAPEGQEVLEVLVERVE